MMLTGKHWVALIAVATVTGMGLIGPAMAGPTEDVVGTVVETGNLGAGGVAVDLDGTRLAVRDGSDALIYEDAGGAWVQTAAIPLAPKAVSITLGGDTLVAGAPQESGADQRTGAVYVYERNLDGSWSQVDKITTDQKRDLFGLSVVVDGNTLLVGASRGGVNTGPGAVYVLERGSDGRFSVTQILHASDRPGSCCSRFGHVTALDGDTAIIGDHSNNALGENAGSGVCS